MDGDATRFVAAAHMHCVASDESIDPRCKQGEANCEER